MSLPNGDHFTCRGSRVLLDDQVMVLLRLFEPDKRFLRLTEQVDELNALLRKRDHEKTQLQDALAEQSSLQAELRRARDLLNAVVENMPDMVALKEPGGGEFRYLLINAAGEHLLGRGRNEIIGKTEREIFRPDEADEIILATKAAIESRRALTARREVSTRSGQRSVEARIVPITEEKNGISQVLVVVRDITEANVREEQIRQLQRLDSVGQLTGGIAHDFNNLLAVMMGSIELVRETLADGSDSAAFADEAIGAAGRGADLVRRLLAFARKQQLQPAAVDLNERLSQVVPLLERTLGESVQVKLKTARNLWPAIIDPTQVDDAVVNLAINARDAMPGGGVLTIETHNVTLDEDYVAQDVDVTPGDYVLLAVSDTGTGMPPAVITRAFEPFYTTKEEGKGTGLGLSQIYGWVKQSAGHIKIYSELGHGSTIKLYLPRSHAVRSAEAPRAEMVTPTGDETILVVEDNPAVRRTVIRQLHGLGYKTIEAASGNAALQLIRTGTEFELLLTDVVMPGGMNGFELADEAKKLCPTVKILFTSGYTELAANGHSIARKEALLSKPYSKSALGKAIRSALDENGWGESSAPGDSHGN